jgi:hypothetical protein
MAKYPTAVEVYGVIICLYKYIFDNGERFRRFQIRVSDTPISSIDIFSGK